MAEVTDLSLAIATPPAAETQPRCLTTAPRSQSIYDGHFNQGSLQLVASQSYINNNRAMITEQNIVTAVSSDSSDYAPQ